METEPVAFELDQNSIKDNFFIDDFEMEDISFVLTMEDGTEQSVRLKESMLSEEDVEKLQRPGIHELEAVYDDFSTSFTIRLVDSLNAQLMLIFDMAVEAEAFDGTYEEWLETVRGPSGEDGREIRLRVANDHIQWQYIGEDDWENLLALDELIGPKGPSGEDGLSAFELFKELNPDFEGTKEDWLADLLGESEMIPHIGDNGNWWIGDSDTKIPATSEPETDYSTDGLRFELISFNGIVGYEVVDYETNDTVVHIPNVIHGLPTISVGSHGFENSSVLQEVHIPDNVQRIEERSFASLQSSLTVKTGEHSQLETIGNEALNSSEFETDWRMPEGVASIGANAFEDALLSSKVVVPQSVTSVRRQAFNLSSEGMPALFEAEEAGSDWHEDWTNQDHDVMHWGVQHEADFYYNTVDENSVRIVGYDGNEREVEIPSSLSEKAVTHIGLKAFMYNDFLGIRISNSVTTIEDYAIKHMPELRYVVIPDSVESFGENSLMTLYKGNDETTHVKLYFEMALPDECEREFCADDGFLSHWEIAPDSVHTSENFQYIKTDGTASVSGYLQPQDGLIIPEKIDGVEVTEVAHLAFAQSSAEKISLPQGLETIGTASFIYVNVESMDIPDTVTTIGKQAFASSDIQLVYIPESVSEVGEDAFIRASNTLILTGQSSKPIGWDSTWAGNQTVYWNVWEYMIKDNYLLSLSEDQTATLLRYDGDESVIVLPETISDYTLTMIESSAISTGLSDAKIVIPESVDYVEANGIDTHSHHAQIFLKVEETPASWDSQWYNNGNVYHFGSWYFDSDGIPQAE